MTPSLVLQVRRRNAARDDDPAPRVGFTASRKVGGAVERNRARRRLRAAVELVMPLHAAPGNDYVVIARKGTLKLPFGELVADLERALRRLNAWRADAAAAARETGQ